MKFVTKLCNWITTAMSYVGMAVICAMVAMVFVDVILRKLFSISMIGVTEMTQMLWICMVLGWGKSAEGNDNLRIDMLVDCFPKRARHIVDIIVCIVMIAICLLTAWRVFENAMNNMEKGVYYSLLNIQTWPFIIVISIGYLGGCLGLIAKVIRHVEALTGKDEREGKEAQA